MDFVVTKNLFFYAITKNSVHVFPSELITGAFCISFSSHVHSYCVLLCKSTHVLKEMFHLWSFEWETILPIVLLFFLADWFLSVWSVMKTSNIWVSQNHCRNCAMLSVGASWINCSFYNTIIKIFISHHKQWPQKGC